jgi:hypothetical protein
MHSHCALLACLMLLPLLMLMLPLMLLLLQAVHP